MTAFGSAFQMALSALCSSAKTPLAVTSSTAMLTSAGTPSELWPPSSPTPRTIDCTASAPSRPTRARSCSATALCTASSPKARPAIATATTSSGASENMV